MNIHSQHIQLASQPWNQRLFPSLLPLLTQLVGWCRIIRKRHRYFNLFSLFPFYYFYFLSQSDFFFSFLYTFTLVNFLETLNKLEFLKDRNKKIYINKFAQKLAHERDNLKGNIFSSIDNKFSSLSQHLKC